MEKTFAEMFAGTGCFRLGLEQAGWKCVWANDWEKATKTKNLSGDIYRYHWNDGTYHDGDIREVDARKIPDHTLLTGGFPCQSFSIAGKRKGFEDTRGTLFFEICRVLEAKQPTMILLENVGGLLSHDEGKTFDVIIESLNNLGYVIDYRVLNSRYFGVPQNRERVFIWGVNLPKLMREYAENGQKQTGLLLLKTIEGYLLRKLLDIWAEPIKQSELKLSGLGLNYLIYNALEGIGLLQKSKSLQRRVQQKLLKRWQLNLTEVGNLSLTNVMHSEYDLSPKNHTLTLTAILRLEEISRGSSFTKLLWRSILEDPSQKMNEYITSTLLKLIIESKTYTYAEIEAIILLFIGLEKKYFQNWLKTTLLLLTKTEENMFGTGRLEKEMFNVLICSVVFGTKDFSTIIGNFGTQPSEQIFPIGEDAWSSDSPYGTAQGEGKRLRRDNPPNQVANTISARYGKDGSENLIQVNKGETGECTRIYDPQGHAPTLNANTGGQHIPKIVVPMRPCTGCPKYDPVVCSRKYCPLGLWG